MLTISFVSYRRNFEGMGQLWLISTSHTKNVCAYDINTNVWKQVQQAGLYDKRPFDVPQAQPFRRWHDRLCKHVLHNCLNVKILGIYVTYPIII